MADIRPFRGIRYDLKRIGDPSTVITPPYDVISTEEQAGYYQSNPCNIIRLDFGKERPADSPQDNRYSRAAAALNQWLSEGILQRDECPAFYLVEHRFQHGDRPMSRFSLFARVRLEDLSVGHIRPHEMTMKGPSEDRLRLLRACNANLSPVMGLFRHRREGLQALLGERRGRPQLTATDGDGVSYSLWPLEDSDSIEKIHKLLADKTIYIADGHHRYATALAYRNERMAAAPSCTGDEGFNFVMMTLTPSEDPNLVMLPTHRLVRDINPKLLSRFKHEWIPYFDRRLLPPLPDHGETVKRWGQSLKRKRGTTFGLYGLDGTSLCLMHARPDMMLPVQPSVLSELDVFILHQVILRQMLGLDSPEREEECLKYTRDGLEAISLVDAGEYQLAFLLNPTPISSVLSVADAGVRMPPKSTYFYPKTPTGLVINPLWDD